MTRVVSAPSVFLDRDHVFNIYHGYVYAIGRLDWTDSAGSR